MGWSIDMALDNHAETYGDYTLHNYDYSTSDTIPMYQALALLQFTSSLYSEHLGIDKALSMDKSLDLI